MKGPLFKWFLIWAGAMAVGVILFWAFGPTAKKIDLAEVNFTTTESATLYFKNMRAYFYDLEEEEKSGFNIYRIGSREEGNSKLHFMIVQNWKMNEAYIMAESDLLDLESSPLQIISRTDQSDTLILEAADAESNYIFAGQLFTALERDASFAILGNNYEEAIDEAQIKSMKTSLKDYFKWVGKLR
jgi:hypothetical protein